jgi:hypothetical protein
MIANKEFKNITVGLFVIFDFVVFRLLWFFLLVCICSSFAVVWCGVVWCGVSGLLVEFLRASVLLC